MSYGVCVDFDETKAVKAGATVPVKLALCDAKAANLSSSSIAVRGVSLTRTSNGAVFPVADAGNANPDQTFRYAGGRYMFNLKTTGLPAGSYRFNFTAGTDPAPHSVGFVVR